MEHIEQQVAQAILEEKSVIEIDGKTYEIAQPTAGTLIMVSALVAQLPQIETTDSFEWLRKAKDAKPLAQIAATMILGAKRVRERRMVTVQRRQATSIFSWLRFKKAVKIISYKEGVTEYEWLSEYLLDNSSVAELEKIIAGRLAHLELGSFFALTTSLSGANLLKSTKEVETASGD